MTHVELAVAAPAEAEETVVAVLAACGTTGSWIPAAGEVRGYFRAPAPDLERRFAAAWREATGQPSPFTVRVAPVRSENWLARWRATLRPVRAGRFRIAAPEVAVERDPGERVIRIEPGLGFGTGEHPTTRALLRWIGEHGPFGRVLDLGTGSGILVLAALAAGARCGIGLDLDFLALDNAARNRRVNRASERLLLVHGSLDALAPDARFDLLTANLDGPTLVRLLPEMALRLADGGRCGVAGCLAGERERLLARAREGGLELVDEREDPDPVAEGAWWSGWFARR